VAVDAVIFDWGGTLTPWHTIDFTEESTALAHAVHAVDPTGEVDVPAALLEAGATVWGRARDHHQSATLAAIFAEAGLVHDPARLTTYREFWEPHTLTDPDVVPLFGWLRDEGIAVGILSNTVWPRAWHQDIFARDGVDDLIDGAVYTSEIAWTKPAPEAFQVAMDAIGAADPAACVYVGDRLYDDIWGAKNAGLRAVYLPHSDIPAAQFGHSVGEPDAVIQRLADLPAVITPWR